MKKLLTVGLAGLSALTLTGCGSSNTLYILNWQEYINVDLVEAFEEEFGVKVVETNLVSNELMYNELKLQSADYDIVFPSDYMIEKLAAEDLILELDTNKLPNLFDENNDRIALTNGLEQYINNCGYEDYFIPYFWGSLGIMYNTDTVGTKQAVESAGWNVFFESQYLSQYDVAMYASSRDSFAAANLALGYDLNTYTSEQLASAEALLKGANSVTNAKYSKWGTDDIKSSINTGTVDIGLVYSGCFFDQLYMNDYENINYDIYIPETNNVFFDAMCIPTASKNVDLAYEFINFMIETENSVANAEYVGYCPVYQNTFDAIMLDPEMQVITKYDAWYPKNVTNGTVYKDLGTVRYNELEEAYKRVRVQ